MAVYNVAPFLEASIDSVVAQDIGFENIQLILVDDGSSDRSGEICDTYALKYPESILVIHKENGGVSSARNEGLKHVQGDYVNFLDSDDMLSINAVRVACDFLDEHRHETDVAAFPMMFFDGQQGEHILNCKFKKGTRVIDLDTQWQGTAQLSMSSAFIVAKSLKDLCFDERLAYAEDAQLLLKILGKKCTLGVISTITYWYRRRSVGSGSAVQNSATNKAWYIPYMVYFQLYIIDYFLENYHYVPLFVQNTLMYHLQWRFMAKIPTGILSCEEEARHLQLVKKTLHYIDDSVIWAQDSLFREQKYMVFQLKYNEQFKITIRENDVGFIRGNIIFRISDFPLKAEFISLQRDICTIRGVLSILPFASDSLCLYARVNEKSYKCDFVHERNHSSGMYGIVQHHWAFRVDIPLVECATQRISFYCEYQNHLILMKALRFGPFFPVSSTLRNAFYSKNGWMLTTQNKELILTPYSKKEYAHKRWSLIKELWVKNEVGYRRSILMRIMTMFFQSIKRKPLWVISDRRSIAGDNGEAFFRYMRKNHSNIHTVFAVAKGSADYKAMKKIGPVVDYNSPWYKLAVLVSDCRLSSAGEVQVYNPFNGYSEPYRDLLQDVKFVFLQHGVTKDDQSVWLSYYSKCIQGFVTAGKPEYDSIIGGDYEYPKDNVWLTGFPRFDRLYRQEEKWITIMPTWREYLIGKWNSETDSRSLKSDVEDELYFRFFRGLLSHPRLLRAAKSTGYHIKFMPHPNFRPYADLFVLDNSVQLLVSETTYREIYAKSELVVTDYSSAVFDFSYLHKPVVYCHFDVAEFFSGNHVYSKGYFDYERDGFGEVEYDLESTVDRIIEYMENGCQLKEKYRKRIDGFFAYNDQHNCQRVYEKIIALSEKADCS